MDIFKEIKYKEYHKNGNTKLIIGPTNTIVKDENGNDAVLWCEFLYHSNGVKRHESWNLQYKSYREDGPSIIKWNKSGEKIYEAWYKNDLLHRIDGPAVNFYYMMGRNEFHSWYTTDQSQCKINPNKSIKHYNNALDMETSYHYDKLNNSKNFVEYVRQGQHLLYVYECSDVVLNVDGPAVVSYSDNEGIRVEHWYYKDRDITDSICELKLKAPLSKEDQMLLKMYL